MKHSNLFSTVSVAAVTFFMGSVHAQEASQANVASRSQTQLQRVAVSGPAVASLELPPLAEVCPGFVQSLDEALRPVAAREGSVALVRVSFKAGAESPSDLRIQDGSLPYRKAVRRAVHELSCQPGVAPGATYQLLVSFNADHAEAHAALDAVTTLAALAPQR